MMNKNITTRYGTNYYKKHKSNMTDNYKNNTKCLRGGKTL